MSEPATNPEDIAIRTAVAADAESIRAIQAATWINTYPNHALAITEYTVKNYLEGAGGEKRDVRRRRILAQIEAPNDRTKTFVSTDDDGTVTGYVVAAIQPDGRKTIGAIYILPEFQSRGIGSALLKRAIDWYPYDSDIVLNVADYNSGAIAFYKRHGFIFSNRPGSDNAVELATGIRIPEREMIRLGAKLPRR